MNSRPALRTCALVDTPDTPAATGQLLAWLDDRYGKRNITAINTGYHHDNLGGNSHLIDRGIPGHGKRTDPGILAGTIELLGRHQEQR